MFHSSCFILQVLVPLLDLFKHYLALIKIVVTGTIQFVTPRLWQVTKYKSIVTFRLGCRDYWILTTLLTSKTMNVHLCGMVLKVQDTWFFQTCTHWIRKLLSSRYVFHLTHCLHVCPMSVSSQTRTQKKSFKSTRGGRRPILKSFPKIDNVLEMF